ncbi:SURF1 family protein [Roseibium denhamense]|uniref:SURF1-like protein n=1 Tax=Roseibium denhamense TaxID=76305 RepID=A0ABY1P3L2_9HYPH|nr:SURF1 family protein [Roseibium denhamense]MTI07725.1 SURF1 family protein [Roseibium denhamense]SMP24880.1 surfeit locus 1 family protein [Roseibium denhamense]
MGRIRKLIIPAIAAAIALAILLNLGFWQLNRLDWKNRLIAAVQESVTKAPVPAPGPQGWDALRSEDIPDYKHVELQGRFLPGAVYYYIALTDAKGLYGGPGYFVYSPFETDAGWQLMINRGFVPDFLVEEQRDVIETPPAGRQTLTGLIRMGEKPNWTTPDPDLDKRIWFARDTDDMASALNAAGEIAPYSVDLDADHTPEAGVPQAGETIISFKNDHLGYALTWFGLAATLIGVFLTYAATILWPRKEGTNGDAAESNGR